MDTNKLTADYICKDDDRLQMALHIYEAMPAVREYLIKDIFKAVGERVSSVEELDSGQLDCRDYSVYFCTERTGDFWVCAWFEDRRRPVLQLCAGVYIDDGKSSKAKRDEIQKRFRDRSNLETWSEGKSLSYGRYIAYAKVHYEHGGRWDDDHFLRRAIRNRDGVVKALAELLQRIYRGMFLDPAQES